MSENWKRAGEEVRRALAAKEWTAAQLAREAKADQGTVLDFLRGDRTPQPTTQGKIEKALGWPPGTLRDYAVGGAQGETRSTGRVDGTVGPPAQDADYAARGPAIRDASLDELLEEVARRARQNNPEAT